MGFKLIEPETVCKACANAKAQQKNLNQEVNQSEVPGERLANDCVLYSGRGGNTKNMDIA